MVTREKLTNKEFDEIKMLVDKAVSARNKN
jgi:hypothetical protein